jgi:DNA-binding transcriptional LysR family regulator
MEGLVAKEMAAYVKQNDRIRFQITESSAQELMDMVRQEKLDMAIVDTTNRDRTLHFRKLCQRNFYVALPKGHPLSEQASLQPQQLRKEPQVAFNFDTEHLFGQWANGISAEENILYTVNTAQAALDLVAAGAGICCIPEACIRGRDDVVFRPLENWHQALYMCILYDKWLEPPIWSFVELLVRSLRNQAEM